MPFVSTYHFDAKLKEWEEELNVSVPFVSTYHFDSTKMHDFFERLCLSAVRKHIPLR